MHRPFYMRDDFISPWMNNLSPRTKRVLVRSIYPVEDVYPEAPHVTITTEYPGVEPAEDIPRNAAGRIIGTHIRINLYYNYAPGEDDNPAFPDAPELGTGPHAQKAMAHMGIEYEAAYAQSVTDSWIFYRCTNIPDELPKWATVFEVTED